VADLVIGARRRRPIIEILETKEVMPLGGHSARYADAEIYAADRAHIDVADVRQHAHAGGALFQELWNE
jgi:ATP-dependent Lhr-like helicase